MRNDGEMLTSNPSAKIFKEKSVFELIEEVLNYFKANQPLRLASVTKYQNKLNSADVLHESDLANAWKNGENTNDYEVVTDDSIFKQLN